MYDIMVLGEGAYWSMRAYFSRKRCDGGVGILLFYLLFSRFKNRERLFNKGIFDFLKF